MNGTVCEPMEGVAAGKEHVTTGLFELKLPEIIMMILRPYAVDDDSNVKANFGNRKGREAGKRGKSSSYPCKARGLAKNEPREIWQPPFRIDTPVTGSQGIA
jgi:hypothetical protein